MRRRVAHFQSSPAWNRSSGPSHEKWYSQQSQINPVRTILAFLHNVFLTKSVCRLLSNISVRLLSWTMGTIQPFRCKFHSGNVLRQTPELVNWFRPTTHPNDMQIPVVSRIVQPQVPTRFSRNILMMIHQSSLALWMRTRTIAPALPRLLALLSNWPPAPSTRSVLGAWPTRTTSTILTLFYTVRVTLTEVWMSLSRPGFKLRTNMMWVWSRLLRGSDTKPDCPQDALVERRSAR